jgi:hypothetical protein
MAVTTDGNAINVSDDGADFASDVKTQITNAAADLNKMSEKTATETITGAKTHEDTLTLDATGASGDVTVLEITMDEIASGNTSSNGLRIIKDDGGSKIQFVPVNDGTEELGERLEYNFAAQAWKFADDVTVIMRSLRTSSTPPSSASDTGITGDITWDSNYIYICVAVNTWKRVSIATW